MSNTLTGLIPVIYEAMDVVPRELVGAIGGVQMDPSADTAALNQTIRSHIVPTMSMSDVAPAATGSSDNNTAFTYADLTISKSKVVSFNWSGEEQKSIAGQYASIVRDQFAQAFRTLANAIENDVVTVAAAGASRATGTAGTTPFGTAGNLSDFANSAKILDDNGAPQLGRSVIMGTSAASNLRGTQSTLFKVNEAGSDLLLRTGNLGALPVEGFVLRQSGQIKSGAAVGTGSGYVIASGPLAAGSTTITVGTGSGTILAGDVVTIDGHQYVVATALSAGSFTINSPGLVQAASTGDTVTVNAVSVKNVFLQKAGFLLATRLPAMPQGGDMATDLTVVTDPVSGLSFQIALYKQYRQILIEVGAAWGTKVLRPDYVGCLLG